MSRDPSKSFHPRALIQIVKEQAPEFAWLPDALASCGEGIWESPAYVGYVSRHNPNQLGSDWQFQNNVVLQHQELGMVVIDVLQGNRLGGIELVDRVVD